VEESQNVEGRGSREIELTVPAEVSGHRLDHFLMSQLPGTSRAKIQRWIENGRVHLDAKLPKSGQKLKFGQNIRILIPPPEDAEPKPERIPFKLYHEDKHIIVLEKPAGMLVHPVTGICTGTLVNALLAHTSDLSRAGTFDRPGIVHRLDRDTSGLLVVAKTDAAHIRLTAQFKQRQVEKRYFGLVPGQFRLEGMIIERKIARDPRCPSRMSAQRDEGRDAVTIVSVLGHFGPLSALEIQILTGRTHQIRVHLASVGFPILGDTLYGKTHVSKTLAPAIAALKGFALHSRLLSFLNPETGDRMRFVSPPPPRFRPLLQTIGAWGQIQFPEPEITDVETDGRRDGTTTE